MPKCVKDTMHKANMQGVPGWRNTVPGVQGVDGRRWLESMGLHVGEKGKAQ